MLKKIFILNLLLFSSFCFAEKISVSVEPGEQWKKRAPQLAVWIEDENGNFVETLFVTESASKKKWLFAPKEGRPESLPQWYKKSGANPAKNNESLDACSSATPKKEILIQKNIPLNPDISYSVKAEVNQSFDYNSTYTKKNSGVDGQPAVLYSGKIIKGNKQSLVIQNSNGNLTSADKIIKNIFLDVE